ncbi:MAG: hypothetical protein R3240_00030 [Gammaproteobacteria bacterium]|nr:hypothetical protein [Gammaproteobacteria bacterium]
MSNPDQAAAQSDDKTVTIEQRVNDVVTQMKKGDDGKYVFPEGTSEELAFAAMAEKRRRDTRSAYLTSTQEATVLKAENDALLEEFVANAPISIPVDEQKELDKLKFDDPDTWREKMQEYERAAKDLAKNKITEIRGSKSEVARRFAVLEQFQKDNPDVVINDDVLALDVPPRIKQKLENNEVSFEEFLTETAEYLRKGKAIGNEDVPASKDLGKVGGGSTASDNAVSEDIVESYKSEIY